MEIFSLKSLRNHSGFITFLLLSLIPTVFLIGFLELSFDEAYYWIYSQNLSFGYFDHPPVIGAVIKVGTFLFGHNEFGVRFGGVALFLSSLFLLCRTCNVSLKSSSFWFLLLAFPLINLSPIFALPDIGILFFCVLYFFGLKKYYEKDNLVNSILLSIAITGMFYSKYHGLLIVVLTVISNLNLFKKKSFYLIICLVVLFYIPHVYWQYQHDFVSFRFHLFGRAEKHFELKNILDFLGGQLLLMGSPILIWSIWKCGKLFRSKDAFTRALVFNSLGFLLFLFLLSFRNQIEANWSLTCAIALLILLSKALRDRDSFVFKLSLFNIFITGLLKVVLIFLPTLASLDIKDNRFNEIYGWKEKRIPKLLELCKDRVLVGDNYQVTSKVAFYLNKPRIPALHLGSRSSQYEILNFEKEISPDTEICYFTSKNLEGSSIIETGYKDAVYVLTNMRFEELLSFYKVSYEEIVRN